jgi:hypothetical protein
LRLTEDRLVSGTLVGRDNGGLMVDTRVGANDSQRGTRMLEQRITVPAAEIREVELRELDWFKTGALIGAVGVGVGVAIAAALGGGEGRGSGPGTDPEEIVVPVFRVRLPFLRFEP